MVFMIWSILAILVFIGIGISCLFLIICVLNTGIYCCFSDEFKDKMLLKPKASKLVKANSRPIREEDCENEACCAICFD